MNNNRNLFNFRVIIHTVQMLDTNINLRAESLEAINNKPYIIKHNARPSQKGYLFPINANKLYDTEIDNLIEFLNTMQQIQADLDILEWVFDRIDIAFDTPLKYDDIYKFSLYFNSLLSDTTGIKNAIDIQDANTKKKRALTIKSPSFEFQIYDKALESGNKHPYCRFEFRFKHINGKDIFSIIKRLKEYVKSLPDSIESIENQRINALYAIWLRESKANCSTQTKNFSEFVRRYSNDIFTINIAKGLHTKICNGNFNNWLKWFKANNNIDFIKKSDIETSIKEMLKALDIYIKI